MSDVAIRAEHLGKQYRLGEVGTGTLSHDLNRFLARIRGKEDPFAKVGEANDRTTKGKSEYVWALKDVGFDVKQGEVLGIIGRNGAGKSTLLKLLSKVTLPTTGRVKVRGRIASLLEVGTGFHPEMTGRENIFQNGAILGMTRAEIKSKFDEIVEFAGVDRYIDTPVKRYSSGMYVRLAFAVAAHLEPEILIVDEVLAVGDAEFQKKCLGKMKDVSVNEGRTVLFVSHNLPAVRQLCDKGLYLLNGTLNMTGTVEDVLKEYKRDYERNNSTEIQLDSEKIKLKNATVKAGNNQEDITLDNSIIVTVVFESKNSGLNLAVSCNIYNDEDLLMFEAPAIFACNNDSEAKEYTIDIIIPSYSLNSGEYTLSIIFGENLRYLLLDTGRVIHFAVDEPISNTGVSQSRLPGLFRPKIDYVVR